jgi:hypothetical protein
MVLNLRWVLDTKTDWPTGSRSKHDFDFNFELLSRLRVAVVRSEKLVAEVGKSSETQKKTNVRCWQPLPSNG